MPDFKPDANSGLLGKHYAFLKQQASFVPFWKHGHNSPLKNKNALSRNPKPHNLQRSMYTSVHFPGSATTDDDLGAAWFMFPEALFWVWLMTFTIGLKRVEEERGNQDKIKSLGSFIHLIVLQAVVKPKAEQFLAEEKKDCSYQCQYRHDNIE